MNIKQFMERYFKSNKKHKCQYCPMKFDTLRGLRIHSTKAFKSGKHKLKKKYGYYEL